MRDLARIATERLDVYSVRFRSHACRLYSDDEASNPVRAKSITVHKAERWPWSSLGNTPKHAERSTMDPGPVRRFEKWLDRFN